MSYVTKNLLPKEKITYQARLHWAIFLKGAVIFLISAVIWLSRKAITEKLLGPSSTSDGLWLVGMFGLLLSLAGIAWGLVLLVGAFLRYQSTELAITTNRVIAKRGLISRHTLELLLAKVEAAGVEQGLLGRLLSYGTVVVIGTGGTREPFDFISNPLLFRHQLHAQTMAQTEAKPKLVAVP